MKRVLVVEDDRGTRHLIRSILQQEGFEITAAGDGLAALKKLRQSRFDLVLLDVWMPRMNGIEFLSRVREEHLQTKVVVLTSDDTPETLLQAVREQAYLFATKPVQPPQLIELVHRALEAEPEPLGVEVLSAKPTWVELLVPCDIHVAERIQGFLLRLKSDLPEDVRDSVGRVFRELLLNAIEWGGQMDPARKVRVSYLRARRMLLYRIADPGKGFSFQQLPHAAVAHASEDPLAHMEFREKKGLRPGGFGILMARAMIDELLYNEVQNEVVFVKYLD